MRAINMKIGTRLYVGFGGIIIVLLGMFMVSHFSLERMTSNKKMLQTSSHFYNEIAQADSMIEKMQRYIILYANTGMQSVFDSVINMSAELDNKLTDIHSLSSSEQQQHILISMKQSLQLLSEQFKRAAEDRAERDRLLNGSALNLIASIEGEFEALMGQENLPQATLQRLMLIEMNVIRAQQSMLLYVTSPDSKRSKNSRRLLMKGINEFDALLTILVPLKHGDSAQAILANMREYKKNIAKIFRLTRGYLFIFNGVIAGQAAEFSRSSLELKNLSRAQREGLFEQLNKTIGEFSIGFTLATSLSVILGMFFAWYTARGIIKPLNKITNTFIALSTDQVVEKIPGLDDKNEIGDMAKSAQVFKDKNNQTEQLLIEATQTKTVLMENREALKLHQENLEEMVQQRTRELEESIVTLKKTQTQLAKSERMASIGNMVQGVAHELNTPVGLALTAVTHIQGDGEKLSKQLEQGKLTKDSLSEFLESTLSLSGSMETSLERAAQLIKSFKLVSVSEHQEHLQEFNLNDHLNNLLASMRRSIDKKFIIENQIASDVIITSYPGVFYQIYTNLMNNSVMHGFEGRDDGVMTISAIIKDEVLILSYRDNGVGMTLATQANIYEAFFTTKRARGGTGLGMNIVQALVSDKLHGEIELTSEVDVGTSYVLKIPLSDPSILINSHESLTNFQ